MVHSQERKSLNNRFRASSYLRKDYHYTFSIFTLHVAQRLEEKNTATVEVIMDFKIHNQLSMGFSWFITLVYCYYT